MITRKMMRRMLDEISEENCRLCEEITYIRKIHSQSQIAKDEMIKELRAELNDALREKESLLHKNKQLLDQIKSMDEKKKLPKSSIPKKPIKKNRKPKGSDILDIDWIPTCRVDDIIAAVKDYTDSYSCY